MRRAPHEYDTELLYNGEVVTLGAMAYRGRTVLPPGPNQFVPLEEWARGVAEQLGGPVSWRASSEGRIIEEGTVYPAGDTEQ
ncbi:MAG: hypothetical protein M0026_12200 [Nocardiopsaceae bacterium]|nr:hypothetical protein [Nocardiopsaceae bacterium]